MAEKKVKKINVSAIKREKQNKTQWMRNKALKSALRTEIKKFLVLLKENKPEELTKSVPTWHKAIDKAYSKGVLSKNAASRKKSKIDLLTNEATRPKV